MMKNTMTTAAAPKSSARSATTEGVTTPVYTKGTQTLPVTPETELPSCENMAFYANPRVQTNGDFPDLNTQLKMLEKCMNYQY